MDEVPTQAPDLVVSLSIALDSRITANPSPALRAARVIARCPSKAAVRALNGAEGQAPPTHPHAAAKLLNLGRQIEFTAAHHLIHRKRSPFPYEGKALNARERMHSPPGRRAAALRSPDGGSVAPARENLAPT